MKCERHVVVKFLSDSTFSEIPTAWLIEEDDYTMCWWPPRTANSGTLIASCASAKHNTWSQYEVNVIKYCCKYISIYISYCNVYIYVFHNIQYSC